MSVPATMNALVVKEGQSASVQEKPTAKPKAGEIVVEVQAVTLNPTDWKHMKFISQPGAIMGCDFAGTVVYAGGEGGGSVKKGDRVAGFVHGGKYESNGSFAQYLTIDAALVIKVPDDVELERAASVGIGGFTAAQALFQRLGLKLPSASATTLPELTSESPQVLVWAGSTSVGQWAVQLARAAGYHVITTASAKNHALLEKMGASEVYDYRDASVPEKISKEHPNLAAALDCISENGTQSLCVRSLGTKGGKVVVLLKPEKEAVDLRKDVEIIHTLIYTCLGKPFAYGRSEFGEEQVRTDREFILHFTNADKGLFHHLLQHKLVNGNRIKLMGQGLQNVLEGLRVLEQGQVSAEKLAYKI